MFNSPSSRGRGFGRGRGGRPVRAQIESASTVVAVQGGKALTKQELAAVAPELLSQMANFSKQMSALPSNIMEELSVFEYQGFKPEIVHRHFAFIRATLKDSQGNPMGDQESFEVFKKDLILIIGLHLEKGAISGRNLSKMSQEGSATVNRLLQTWRIATTRRPTNEDVTIQRVANAYPIITCQIAQLKSRSFGEISSQLPGFIRCSAFPSIIPKSERWASVSELLIVANRIFGAEQSLTISQNYETFADAYEGQEIYAMASYNSTTIDESTREKCMSLFMTGSSLKTIYNALISVNNVRITRLLNETYSFYNLSIPQPAIQGPAAPAPQQQQQPAPKDQQQQQSQQSQLPPSGGSSSTAARTGQAPVWHNVPEASTLFTRPTDYGMGSSQSRELPTAPGLVNVQGAASPQLRYNPRAPAYVPTTPDAQGWFQTSTATGQSTHQAAEGSGLFDKTNDE